MFCPSAGPSSDPPKKNLSAFCSDMLDEYLENEGKLIDERAASFCQPRPEPVVYELPVRSSSYVRTLDNVLTKQPSSSPTSDLIAGFVPPSKRPKLSLRKASRKGERNPRGLKQNRAEPVQNPATGPPSGDPPVVTEHQKSKKKNLKVRLGHSEPLPLKRRRKLKPQSSSQTLSAPVSEDMAPLESDSELGADQDAGPQLTRALLKQKDLEAGVVWEGRPRTFITEERAAVALTSLFTLMVSPPGPRGVYGSDRFTVYSTASARERRAA